MPTITQIEVKELNLDLKNFRTTPQQSEIEAIKAMISIKPDRFYAVLESLITDGYLPTENIIVLQNGNENIVKEGNRRIASLKLIHGYHSLENFSLPEATVNGILGVDEKWKRENLCVPCTVFGKDEADKVDRVVSLAHGKGEKASRDPWNSVARARHNRDFRGLKESGLDLLEKYLLYGNNINNQQRLRWGGDYNLTVLDEAMRKCFTRLGFSNVTELVDAFPKLKFRSELEEILLEIGLGHIKFETIRSSNFDFPTNYGILPIIPQNKDSNNDLMANNTNTTLPPISDSKINLPQKQTTASSNIITVGPTAGLPAAVTPTPTVRSVAPKAISTNDPKNVAKLLKGFTPRGENRQKVVALRDEIKKLNISNNPIAFCFLLRSLFEISAIVYFKENGLNTKKSNGHNKTLVELLKEVTANLTNNEQNDSMNKVLHGAKTEISKPEGILSVTSMNQLVHNPAFSIIPSDICILFNNIYPLLEAMN